MTDFTADVDWTDYNAPVIFFDGDCTLCNRAVQFILRYEQKPILHFAPLAGQKARQILPRGVQSDSIVLSENQKVYTESTAVLRIARYLSFPWNLCTAFIVIPKSIRNLVYRYIARNRYRWFGKADHCLIPASHNSKRFYT